MRLCEIEGCGRKHYARGWCTKHYQRWENHGSLLNTTCLFETSTESWHGHPDPIVGNHVRRSLATYYWRPIQPSDRQQDSTVWAE